MIASKSASSSAYEVSIRHLMFSSSERTCPHLHPAAVGQPDVEHRHIRARRRDPDQGVGGRARLADHLDVGLGGQQLMDATPDDLVIVEQEKYP
ncbi:hypothetical protein SCYAM73S_01895 [Streptomyces cyaneofuscatus]